MFHSKCVIVAMALTFLGAVGCGVDAPTSTSKNANDPSSGGPPSARAPIPVNPVLDALVGSQLDATSSAGMAAAIVKGGELRWANGFGLANIANKTPVTVDTLFQLASVSKTITAAAVMQLVESGALGLDDAVDGLPPFAVKNPRFGSRPVTVRNLLTHTSSILDPNDDLYAPGDTKISLERYLRGTLVPGGEYYAASNWAARAPGAKYEYSNTGVTLLGYLVQLKEGVSFESYTKTHIFDPLGMTETAWRLADLDTSHIAMPYTGKPGRYKEAGLYGSPDFPAGMLRTSVRQLSTFLRMFINGGEIDGVRILRDETIAEMSKVQVPASGEDPDQGLIWFYQDFGGRRVLLHDGSDPGVFALMGFDPRTKVGAIILTNGDAERSDAASDALNNLFGRLLDEGEKL